MKILATDKNCNVRKLLKRELAIIGHDIVLAHSPAQIHEILTRDPGFDLIILDPDQFFVTEPSLFSAIKSRENLSIIIHGFEQTLKIPPGITHIFIPKNNASIDEIKTFIRRHPHSGEQ